MHTAHRNDATAALPDSHPPESLGVSTDRSVGPKGRSSVTQKPDIAAGDTRSVLRPHDEADYFYDWNAVGEAKFQGPDVVELDDETLRDGLQGPSVRQPTLEEKTAILHHMEALGIHGADIGYPGASEEVMSHCIALAKEISREGLSIKPNCAGRTHPSDIMPIVETQQQSGVPIEAALFLGSSPIRQYVEGWDVDFLVKAAHDSVSLARREGVDVMFVTEDTTRAPADVLRRVYTTAIEAGATRICLSDTVGHATPWGAAALVKFARQIVADTGEDVKIDWHGHRDRNMSVINSLAALTAGATRVHGAGLGIGERVGNTPMDTLLVNLQLLGWLDTDLTELPAYCEAVSKATDTPIPYNMPAVGKDAFETGSGVHAAAILKAMRSGDEWLVNRIYSGVPADILGREQEITVGPMSGKANAVAWLTKRGHACGDAVIDKVMAAAKASDRVLTEEEILGLLPTESTK